MFNSLRINMNYSCAIRCIKSKGVFTRVLKSSKQHGIYLFTSLVGPFHQQTKNTNRPSSSQFPHSNVCSRHSTFNFQAKHAASCKSGPNIDFNTQILHYQPPPPTPPPSLQNIVCHTFYKKFQRQSSLPFEIRGIKANFPHHFLSFILISSLFP